MLIHVRLFARARELAGADRVAVELAEGETVAGLRRQLAARHPALAGLLERCALAVNEELAGDAMRLNGADEVAILPPVSGG
jgi:molybdopterin converting factor subunit 1